MFSVDLQRYILFLRTKQEKGEKYKDLLFLEIKEFLTQTGG